MVRSDLTAERLRELLSYDPETGIFRWLNKHCPQVKVGDVAGGGTCGDYRSITIHRIKFREHRLAFLYMNGEWPPAEIDHKDGNPSNNLWSNLRPVSRTDNAQNLRGARVTNLCGLLGVSRADSKWRARLQIDGRQVTLGRFATPELAHAVYLAAKRKFHPGNTL